MVLRRLLFLLLTASACGVSAHTAEPYLTYDFDAATGVLSIAGNGATIEYKKVTAAIGRDKNDQNTTLKEVDLSGTTDLREIGEFAFRDCTSLTRVTIPDSVTSIGNEAFYYCCSLASIIIPERVTFIGDGAFSVCLNLTSITIPEGVTSIGNNTFSLCRRLVSVTIPNSVVSIGNEAFEGCGNLAGITIPNSVVSIGNEAFGGCSGLTSIVIPKGVTYIGDYAFYSCYDLIAVTLERTSKPLTTLDKGAFVQCHSSLHIKVPNRRALKRYKAMESWRDYSDKIIGNK